MSEVVSQVHPREILRRFSDARILVGMEQADPGSRVRGHVLTVTHGGYIDPNPPPILRLGQEAIQFRRKVVKIFLEEVVAATAHILHPSRDVLIEWLIWPQITIDDKTGRAYGRLAVRPRA